MNGLALKWRTRNHPRDARASALLADAHLADGNVDDARSVALAGLAAVSRVEVAQQLANVLRRTGDLKGAFAAHQKAVELGPTDSAAHAGLGRFALQFRRAKLACTALSRASALAPEDPILLGQLGQAYVYAGQNQDAVAVLRLAFKHRPNDVALALLLGRAASAAGHGDLAIRVVGDAAERAPQRLDLRLALSKYIALHDTVDAALALLIELRRGWPNSPEVLQNLAVAQAELGFYDEALKTITAAKIARPDQPVFERNRGAILFRAGKIEEAAGAFEALTRRMPENAEAHLLLATALHRLRQVDSARVAAEAAIRLAGQGQVQVQARQLRDRLTASPPPAPVTTDDPMDPRVILSGTIERAPITQLLEFARTNATTGSLAISSPQGIAELTLGEGQMLWATCSNSPNLGDRLVERGWLERSVFSVYAERHRAAGGEGPIGRQLVEAELLTAEQLAEVCRAQIYAVVRLVMHWSTGSFSLLRAESEPDMCGPALRIDYLLLDVMRLIDEEALQKSR